MRQLIGSFNPRARVGRDGVEMGGGPGRNRFNPRARVGRDRGRNWGLYYHEFQSTRPRGARLGGGR